MALRHIKTKRSLTLKSNMDRFIVSFSVLILPSVITLKSNMDRFIVELLAEFLGVRFALKSNMDRFIGLASQVLSTVILL